jgi:hypothetical protein
MRRALSRLSFPGPLSDQEEDDDDDQVEVGNDSFDSAQISPISPAVALAPPPNTPATSIVPQIPSPELLLCLTPVDLKDEKVLRAKIIRLSRFSNDIGMI